MATSANTEELDAIATPAAEIMGKAPGGPGPRTGTAEEIANDPLLDPRDDEPGVQRDGSAAPAENPGGPGCDEDDALLDPHPDEPV